MGVGENPTRLPDRRWMRARSPVKVRHERDAKWRWCGTGRREDEFMARDAQLTLQADRPSNPRWPPACVHEIVQVLEAPLLRTEPERASEPTRRWTRLGIASAHATDGPMSCGRNVRRMNSRAGTRRWSSASNNGVGSYGSAWSVSE